MSQFLMPSLGADMEDGTLIEWLKQPGDAVKRGDVMAVVETQKGAIEIEVFEDGVIARHLIAPGTKVPVGTPLAELTGTGPAAVPGPRPAPTKPAPPPAPSPPVPPSPPRMPPAVPSTAAREVRASPAARALATERNFDLRAIKGSGPDGAVVFVDVENALRAPPSVPPSPPETSAPKAARGVDLGEMRKAIAAAMARAKREIPHYYLSHDIDLTPAQDRLARLNAERPPTQRLLMGALYVRAVAAALVAMPEFNGFFVDGAFRPGPGIHVGMAIAIRGGGLIAPAIHDADRLTLDQVMERLRDLVARVRTGRLRGSELTGATITVSSLGDRGVDMLTGVIHPPQVALIGLGAPRLRPWVVAGQIAPRQVLTATLAADHRAGDGHRGALFLAKIADLLEAPEGL